MSTERCIGLIMMDLGHAKPSGESTDGDGVLLPPWAWDRDHVWPWPVKSVVARGATAQATLQGTDAAIRGVREAANALDGRVDLIVGNCGFFVAASETIRTRTPTLLSSLALLDLTLSWSTGEVGIVTYSASDLNRLLAIHEHMSRLRIVGLNDMPDWRALGTDNYMETGGWSLEGLRDQLISRVATESSAGPLRDISALILECTVLPFFRNELREAVEAPLIDLHSLVEALLK